MKKVLFTAIALVAFSSASMANTIVDDSENEVLRRQNCVEYVYHAVQLETQSQGQAMSYAQFQSAFNYYYSACTDANNSGATILDPVFIP